MKITGNIYDSVATSINVVVMKHYTFFLSYTIRGVNIWPETKLLWLIFNFPAISNRYGAKRYYNGHFHFAHFRIEINIAWNRKTFNTLLNINNKFSWFVVKINSKNIFIWTWSQCGLLWPSFAPMSFKFIFSPLRHELVKNGLKSFVLVFFGRPFFANNLWPKNR